MSVEVWKFLFLLFSKCLHDFSQQVLRVFKCKREAFYILLIFRPRLPPGHDQVRFFPLKYKTKSFCDNVISKQLQLYLSVIIINKQKIKTLHFTIHIKIDYAEIKFTSDDRSRRNIETVKQNRRRQTSDVYTRVEFVEGRSRAAESATPQPSPGALPLVLRAEGRQRLVSGPGLCCRLRCRPAACKTPDSALRAIALSKQWRLELSGTCTGFFVILYDSN